MLCIFHLHCICQNSGGFEISCMIFFLISYIGQNTIGNFSLLLSSWQYIFAITKINFERQIIRPIFKHLSIEVWKINHARTITISQVLSSSFWWHVTILDSCSFLKKIQRKNQRSRRRKFRRKKRICRADVADWRPLPPLSWSLAPPPPLHRSPHCVESVAATTLALCKLFPLL